MLGYIYFMQLKTSLFTVFFTSLLLTVNLLPTQARPQQAPLKVGVSGSEPFVTDINQQTGISLEIWQAVASMENLDYKLISYKDVPDALSDLNKGKLDIVVGPVSITPERAKLVKFTQPYYQSSISIMSRNVSPSVWHRIVSFFNIHFVYAVLVFLFILAIVGTLLWLAERDSNPKEFSPRPLYGIPDGMWCAIVTMTTTGYGDIAPQTLWGRIIAGCWMILAIVFATTMIAGITSTLSVVASTSTNNITKAEQLNNKKVAVVKNSPSEDFAKKYGAQVVFIKTLKEGYDSLRKQDIDAVIFDRPQMLYFLKNHKSEEVAVSDKRYMRQGYGFAVPANSKESHQIDISLLKLQKSGRVERTVNEWLGRND
jgi:polar amino acid transport system substrate-binding protein